jgi:hypothetical protein
LVTQAASGQQSVKAASGDSGSVTAATAAAQLDTLIAAEDPFNGESVVRLLTRPFIDITAEAAELQSWDI